MVFVYKQKHVEDDIPAFRVQRVKIKYIPEVRKTEEDMGRQHSIMDRLLTGCAVTESRLFRLDGKLL